jgi:hypothetical protein
MRAYNIKFVWSIVLTLAFVVLPSISFAATSLDPGEAPVPFGELDTTDVRNPIAGGPGRIYGLVPCEGTANDPCNFEEFVRMINMIIKWIISIAGVIFAITLIWGGFLYMKSGDNPGNKSKATGMMWNTLKGFVIILTAWLIVYTILKTLAPNYPSLFEFIGKN